MPGNTSGGMHIRNARNRPQVKIMRRLTYFISAINDTDILLIIVAELSAGGVQTARFFDTPAAIAKFTVCGI